MLLRMMVAAMISMTATVAFAQSKTISGGPYFGCKDPKVDDKITKMMVQNDEQAWKKMLLSAVMVGECRLWKDGESVYLEEAGWVRHCLRPAGDVSCFWTPMEAIRGSK